PTDRLTGIHLPHRSRADRPRVRRIPGARNPLPPQTSASAPAASPAAVQSPVPSSAAGSAVAAATPASLTPPRSQAPPTVSVPSIAFPGIIGPGDSIDVCAALSSGELEAIVGHRLVKTLPGPQFQIDRGCMWSFERN